MDKEHLSLTSVAFPFTAIIGVEEAKKALMIALVSERIRTVLIQGTTGSAKTTLVRSLSGICEKNVVNLPLGTNDDQIFGTIDIEKTLLTAERVYQAGLLEKSDGNILHADDANLMDNAVLDQLLESVITGKVILEKEGISREYRCDTTFVGTMNISETPMHPHLMDRFDICVRLPRLDDEPSRYDIVKKKIQFDSDPQSFSESYTGECRAVRDKIMKARERMPYVSISDDILKIVAELCSKSGAEGHRGDIALVNTSMAIAALDDRDEVTLDDIKEAAQLCLRHRITKSPEDSSSSSSRSGNDLSNSEPPPMSNDDGNSSKNNNDDLDESKSGDEEAAEETVFNIGSTFNDLIVATTMSNIRELRGKIKYLTDGGMRESLHYNLKQIELKTRTLKEYGDIGILDPEWMRVKDAFMKSASSIPKDVNVQINADGLLILADYTFDRAFTHLIEESIKSKKLTKIKLSYKVTKGRLLIIYEDDGDGIPYERKSVLFTGDIRSESIGFFVVNAIINASNFEIMECGDPSKGARYEISVPADSFEIF